MKLKANDIERFLAQPPAKYRVALIFGPDEGLVRERAMRLCDQLAGPGADPLGIVNLSDADIAGDPARIADEFGAVSMFGGRRIIRARAQGEKASRALASFIDSLESDPVPGDAVLVIEGGDLRPGSALRKSAERAQRAAAVACYADDARSLRRLVFDMLKTREMTIDEQALSTLVSALGGDRQLTRQEVEKLVLYKMAEEGDRHIGVEDVEAVVVASNDLGTEDVSYAAATGDVRELQRALDRCFFSQSPPVAVLRGAARHFERLSAAVAHKEKGRDVRAAAGELRPPVHFKRRPAFERQVAQWSGAACQRALGALFRGEIGCKTTGLPHEAVCRHALLSVARMRRH